VPIVLKSETSTSWSLQVCTGIALSFTYSWYI